MSSEPSASAKAGRPSDDLYRAVSTNRRSEQVVEQIRELIGSERLRPGDKLPSERHLGERMGTSRVTIREALRVLEANGLVEIRLGARGGAYVTTPSSSKVSDGLADLIALSAVTATEVTEARQIFELGIIPLVVERVSPDDITALQKMVESHVVALEQGGYLMSMSAAFHVRLAACTHNSAIEMLARAFHGPVLMSLREAYVAAPMMRPRGVEEHRALVAAIADHETDRAYAIMKRHLTRTARRLERVKGALQDERAVRSREPVQPG